MGLCAMHETLSLSKRARTSFGALHTTLQVLYVSTESGPVSAGPVGTDPSPS